MRIIDSARIKTRYEFDESKRTIECNVQRKRIRIKMLTSHKHSQTQMQTKRNLFLQEGRKRLVPPPTLERRTKQKERRRKENKARAAVTLTGHSGETSNGTRNARDIQRTSEEKANLLRLRGANKNFFNRRREDVIRSQINPVYVCHLNLRLVFALF